MIPRHKAFFGRPPGPWYGFHLHPAAPSRTGTTASPALAKSRQAPVVVFVVQEFPFWPVTWKRRTGLVLEQMGMLSGAKAKVENRRKNEAFTRKEWAVCKRFYSAEDY
jgi:hypothetical protein